MSKKIVLIDGHSILNRAFFGLPDLTNSEGTHTNAVYGFLNILFKILDEEKPDYLTVAFDVKAPTFRHVMYDAYKGTRKPMADELREQVPLIKQVLTAMGVTIIEKAGYEADDILGTIAKTSEAQGIEVSLVSGDRDLLQLASEHIKIRIPKTKRTGTEVEDYYAADVLEKYQVTPQQFIDVKALMGDTADNIPGVPGIGEKTATNLIVAYGSIENAQAHVEEIKPNRAKTAMEEHYDMAEMSKVLATIKIDCELDYHIEDAVLENLYTPAAYELFQRLEFKNMLSRFDIETPMPDAEKYFTWVDEKSKAEKIFAKAEKMDRIALELVTEGGVVYGAVLVLGEEEIYFIATDEGTEITLFSTPGEINEDYLMEKICKLEQNVPLMISMDVKSLVKRMMHNIGAAGDAQAVESVLHAEKYFDVVIAAYLLNPLKNDYTYEDIAREYAGMMVQTKAELIGKYSYPQAMTEKKEEFLKYVCYSAYCGYQAYEPLKKALEKTDMWKLFTEIEMPLIFAIAGMELTGIKAEASELKEYGDQLSVRIKELEQQIYEEAGENFNINSPKQLGVILFEKLEMPNGKKTKTGYSTAADVLDKLAPDYPIVAKILEYRQLTKLKSTYADGLANYIEADGRIHTSFNQTITATGRISSTEPNLQNIPIRMELGRLIRKVFVPKEGYVFVDADYSQIELRVLAHMSGDEKLIQAYREAQDIHTLTASQVFHVPFDEVTPLLRRNAKAVNFGIVYGISSFGLSQDLSITRKEAAQYIEQYFETYPGIKTFLDGLVEHAKEDGYVTSLYGRRRPMPELQSSNFMQRSFGERVAMNAPIQGTAADIMKIAMIRVDKRLREEQLESKLLLQVHDELLVEAKESELEQVKEILGQEMMHAAELSVSLEIDMHTGHNWYEAK